MSQLRIFYPPTSFTSNVSLTSFPLNIGNPKISSGQTIISMVLPMILILLRNCERMSVFVEKIGMKKASFFYLD